MAKYALAMYDIRGKQEFIFKTNKIKEIVGGSCIIRDCFKDYLYPAAVDYANNNPAAVGPLVFERASNGKNTIFNYQNIEKEEPEGAEQIDTASKNKLVTEKKNLQSAIKKEKDKSLKKELEKQLKPIEKKLTELERNEKKQQKKETRASDGSFSVSNFKRHINDEGYLGEVVYEGGGNFYVLYKDKETCIEINRIFTKEILKNIGTLKVLCTCIDVDEKLDDWGRDSKELREKHRINEARECNMTPSNGCTLTAVDPNTSMPLVEDLKNLKEWKFNEARNHFGVEGRVSRESYAKLLKYSEELACRGDEYGENVLDNLVKDEDNSLLAVVYIDGNHMGAYVENCLKNSSNDYETRINKLRKISLDIQEKYVLDPKKAIDESLKAKHTNSKKSINRFVVFAGDEMNFIVKAEDALEAVLAYFSIDENGKSKLNSCAGVSIFHSHAPYGEAYRIAEACCESGKKRMKHENETNTCYFDYHFCQSGLGRDLDTIRNLENGNLISKPWLINWGENSHDAITLREIQQAVEELNALGARSNIKILAERAKSSLPDFDLEMERIYAHQSKEIQKKIKHLFLEMGGEKRRRMVYDIVIAYDLWFRPAVSQEKEV